MKKITFISALAFLLISTLGIAQEDYSNLTGYIIDDIENAAALKACPDNRLGSRSDELPVKVNLKEEINIKQQLGKTCVSHAIAHAMTIMWVRKDGILVSRDIDKYMFSPCYIHNQIADNCESPTRLTDGLDLLKQQGIALAGDFNSDDNCTKQPDEMTVRKARKYKIKDYLAVFVQHYTEEEKVTSTKKQLINGYPVILGINIPQVFSGIKKGVKTLEAEVTDLPAYGHALCVVGYDDYRGAFELMNSWGTDWANDGYIWIKYDDYARYAKYGYIAILGDGEVPELIVSDTPTTKEIALEGAFALRTLAGYDEDNEKPIFEQTTPILSDDMYLFPDWNSMNSYQLVGTGMTAHSYMYVFSIDAEDKAELHFPKTTKDIDVDAAEEVPLNSIVPPADEVSINKIRKTPRTNVSPLKKEISSATMILPSDMTALQSVHAGTDNICVIYSDKRIDDIQERIERVRQATQKDFKKRLKAGFKDIFVPAKDIKYAADGMSFTAKSDKGTAVPLVLNVVINE